MLYKAKKFIYTPFFIIIIHLVLVLFIIVIVNLFLSTIKSQIEIDKLSSRNLALSDIVSETTSPGSYLSSETFKLKIMKSSNSVKKVPGEKIIDTSTLENGSSLGDKNYIPDIFRPTNIGNNWEKWKTCLTATDLNYCNR